MTGVEIIGLVSIGANLLQSFFTRRKAKQVTAIIRGVEAGASTGLESDPTLTPQQIQHAAKAIKNSIKAAATAAGVEPALNKEVKRLTHLVAYRR